MKLLVITDSWHSYGNYLEESGLPPKDVKRIANHDDIRGFHSPIKYVLLRNIPDLLKVLEYMEHHGIVKEQS